MVVCSWFLLFATLTLMLKNAESALCSRILFRQPSDDSILGYKEIINGIYVTTTRSKDDFPIFIHERGEIYFSFTADKNNFYFSYPTDSNTDMLGLSAVGNSAYTHNFATTESFSTSSTFSRVVKAWHQWNTAIRAWEVLPQKLQVVCADVLPRPILSCGESAPYPHYLNSETNKVIFIENLGNVQKYEFQPLRTDDKKIRYQFYRIIYTNVDATLLYRFLYYRDNHWNVGHYYTSTSRATTYWRAKDQALKPEYITQSWVFRYNRGSAYIQCKGSADKCYDSYCGVNGVCRETSLQQSICTCTFSYAGTRCQQDSKRSCSNSDDITMLHWFEGSIGMVTCGHGGFYNVICENGGWNSEGGYCKSPTTYKPATTPYRYVTAHPTYRYDEDHKSSFDADDHIWIVVVGCLLIACLPTILPLFCISKGVFRMYSLSFYVATWILILYIIASFTLDLKNNYGETTFGTLNIVALPFIMVYYIVVLMESFFCSEKDYISNSYEGEANLTSFLQSLISTKPEVSVYVNCYHYETRTRQVHYTDADGNTQLQMETYLEKVVTVSQQRLFAFLNWLDVSDQNLPKVDGKMLRVKLEKAMTFADEHTRLEFTRFRDNFVAELRGMDQFIEHFEQLEVKGFKEKVTGLAEGRPWWFNRCCLHFSHIILLGWPFRLLVKSSSDQAEFTLNKQISLYKDITNQNTGIYADLSVKNNETAPPRAPDNAYQAGPPRELNNVYQAGPNQQGDVYQAGANMGYDAQTENIYQTIPGEKS